MNLMWSPNPRKGRRRRRKSSAKRRSRRSLTAAQIAAGFGGGKKHRRRGRRRTAVARVHRRGRRRSGGFLRASGAMGLLKTGVVLGAGGVLVDVAMGQVRSFLPASMQTPTDAGGNPQYGYYAAKAALAIALGRYGTRLPVIGRYAPQMAEGALGIMAYQFLRPMVPASLSLGAYFNPAPTQRPALRGVGAYASIPVRGNTGSGRGARAMAAVGMVNNSRQAA